VSRVSWQIGWPTCAGPRNCSRAAFTVPVAVSVHQEKKAARGQRVKTRVTRVVLSPLATTATSVPAQASGSD
jgi:hypothetical protein